MGEGEQWHLLTDEHDDAMDREIVADACDGVSEMECGHNCSILAFASC